MTMVAPSVITSVMHKMSTPARVSRRSTYAWPFALRCALTICGTSTALSTPPAMTANRKLGARFATSKAFAAPMLTPTAAMSSQVRTTPSTRETKVPAAIVEACRPSRADPVVIESAIDAARFGVARFDVGRSRTATRRGLVVALVEERHLLRDTWRLLDLHPCFGDAQPGLATAPADRSDHTDHHADGEQERDDRGGSVLPVGAHPEDEGIARGQGRTRGCEHLDVHGDVTVGDRLDRDLHGCGGAGRDVDRDGAVGHQTRIARLEPDEDVGGLIEPVLEAQRDLAAAGDELQGAALRDGDGAEQRLGASERGIDRLRTLVGVAAPTDRGQIEEVVRERAECCGPVGGDRSEGVQIGGRLTDPCGIGRGELAWRGSGDRQGIAPERDLSLIHISE